MGILVGTGPMFPHAQLLHMVFSAPCRVVFVLNFAAATSKVVKKAKPRAPGRGGRNNYMRSQSLFPDGWRGAGRIFGVIEFGACLDLFSDIDHISESVEFKRLSHPICQGKYSLRARLYQKAPP